MRLSGGRLFRKIVNKQLKNVNKSLKIEKQLTAPKRILALLTQHQKCIFSELQSKQISNFDLGHPVLLVPVKKFDRSGNICRFTLVKLPSSSFLLCTHNDVSTYGVSQIKRIPFWLQTLHYIEVKLPTLTLGDGGSVSHWLLNTIYSSLLRSDCHWVK